MATDFSSKQVSETYSEGVVAEELCLRPIILSLLENIADKTVLDIGCGDGRYSIVLANRGAKVIAIDASRHQLEIAKKKNYHPNVAYNLVDVSMNSVENSTADFVLANMVLPDLDGADKFDDLVKTAGRVLKRNGKFICSTLHPLYLCLEQDSYDKAMDFNFTNYFSEGSTYQAEAMTNSGNKMSFNETHFSLTCISEIFQKNGFVIESLVESRQLKTKNMLLPKYIVFVCVFG